MMSNGHVHEEEEEEEEEEFFDSREEVSSLSDSCPESPSTSRSIAADESLYKVWFSNPGSVRERRARFMRWMGLDACPEAVVEDPDISRMTSNGDALLRSSVSVNSTSTSSCSASCPCASDESASEDSFEIRMIKNLEDGSVFVVDQFGQDGNLRDLRDVGSNRSLTLDEFDRNFGPSSFVQKLMQRDDGKVRSEEKAGRSRRSGWLWRLGRVACVVDRQEEEIELGTSHSRAPRVKVHRCKKRSMEFSAVYMEQEIDAHNGAILTMKFSPDGEFLASGGEDGVVRVWKVSESERRDDDDKLEYDPSCVYFTVNHNSELAPLNATDKEKIKSCSVRRTSDSACVVIPPEVFRISENPLHEFHGHDGDVLDLSWSTDKCLLSSSTDKTVRLWKVGCDSCLKVFAHNNYVTSVQFNPTNENYFVSGSIDGKIRIWEVSQRRVVDWTDIRDIVTAVCYHPEGKGIVVGSMTGDCRFYDVSDYVLELEVQISLQGKKKSPDKRITGFQYCPSDHRKLMVTSADSQVRILDGLDIVSKYKGLRNAGSQISASFTSDGRHIISASEDSYVCVWAHDHTNDSSTSNNVKSTKSCERFISTHVSVAIPWQGQASRSSPSEVVVQEKVDSTSNNTAGSFTLSNGLFSEGLPKGSATWPEEKLPSSPPSTAAALCKSQYKFLKTSCRNSPHSWGQVIVTAGWDGRIRSFQNYGLPVNH
ncbi:WD repeat-containing protein 44-like [Iris pallida]|uniref:WD repeat-containing protein 44-like n=1 Tax=Iris pallida TaxID=29817 RepID=A0AAX6E2N2_IRIPA|nr:WD repeat-containing protein 44-like [Iris pallida]KAJ6827901.1 WD repeat-containing protein 44-like [Iris pallida]